MRGDVVSRCTIPSSIALMVKVLPPDSTVPPTTKVSFVNGVFPLVTSISTSSPLIAIILYSLPSVSFPTAPISIPVSRNGLKTLSISRVITSSVISIILALIPVGPSTVSPGHFPSRLARNSLPASVVMICSFEMVSVIVGPRYDFS